MKLLKLVASLFASIIPSRRQAAPALPPQDTGAILRDALGMNGLEYQPTAEFDSITGMGSPWFRK